VYCRGTIHLWPARVFRCFSLLLRFSWMVHGTCWPRQECIGFSRTRKSTRMTRRDPPERPRPPQNYAPTSLTYETLSGSQYGHIGSFPFATQEPNPWEGVFDRLGPVFSGRVKECRIMSCNHPNRAPIEEQLYNSWDRHYLARIFLISSTNCFALARDVVAYPFLTRTPVSY